MSTAANGGSNYDGSGAGGKFRRKPLRKAQATPYDRPPIAVRNPSSGNGWLSKIIDPASKIITASAHRLFSSVFRKRLLPPPQQQVRDPPPIASQPASDVNRPPESQLRGQIQENVRDQYGTRNHAEDHENCINQGLSDLEKTLEQKTFTKSEIDRLTALLNSRTIDGPGVDDKEALEARASETVYGNTYMEEPKFTPFSANSSKNKRNLDATSSPVASTKGFEEEIATPAELAKAYMGSRSSKVPPSLLGSRAQAIKNGSPLIDNVVFPSPSPSTSTATKTFPGLITSENGYMTARSRGRSAIYSMARTPYSRVKKSADISNNYNFQSSQLALEPNSLSNSWQTNLKRRSSVLEDDIDSVGNVRRIRQKPLLTPSQRLTGPAGQSPPVVDSGVVSNHRANDAAEGTRRADFMSVPSQSSEVAQKILQQLDTLAPSREKLSERKSTNRQGNSSFTLTSDMLTGQALRSLEKVDSAKFMELSQESVKPNDLVQKVTAKEDYSTLNFKNQVEENGPKKMASNSHSVSETALNLSERPLSKNKRPFQMSAHEDVLDSDENNGSLNDTSNGVAIEKVNHVNSYPKNKPQMVNMTAAKDNSVSNEERTHVSFHLNNKSSPNESASNGSSTLNIQPSVNDTRLSSLFGKVSSGEQSTTPAPFGHGDKIADKFTPFTFKSSSHPVNGSQAIQTSSPSELKTSNSSVPSDAREGNTSTASLYDVSTTSTMLSSGPFANNGYANVISSSQPVMPSSSAPQPDSKNLNDNGGQNLKSSFSPVFSASITNTAVGITSNGGGNLFSTPALPVSASPVFNSGPSFKEDPPLFSTASGSLSAVDAKAKPVSALTNINSNPFGGVSSETSNSKKLFSTFGSSMSSPTLDNQSLGSLTNPGAAISQAFQYGSSGFSSAPTFGTSGTNILPSASASFSVPAANVFGSNTSFGMNTLPSSKDVGNVGSTSGFANSLLGSNLQSNSSPLFGSTTSSSTTPLPVISAASSASASAVTMPGSIFTAASAGSTFSFTSASANASPSPFTAPQPVFGSTNPLFSFGPSASPVNNGTNSPQMSVEDTMAEDTVQASSPLTPTFGQPQSTPNTGFVFSQSPSVIQPSAIPFQFASQPSPAAPVNQSTFQASTSFNAGGSFSLGTGGGDKSGRKIIKVKKGPRRR